MFRIDRRQFLLSSTALAAAAAFSPAISQENRLRLMWWGSQARADRTFKVADAYKAEHAGVGIDGEFLAYADYWPKVATIFAGGNAPDIVQMDFRYLGEYARRGVLAPLDGKVDVSDLDAAQLKNGTIDGKLYGISLGVATGATLYNKTALEEVGIKIDPIGWTFDDILTKGTEFVKATKRNMKFSADASGTELFFENYLRQHGKALYTPEGQLGFTADELTSWFDQWAKLRAAGVILSAEDQALETVGKVDTTGLVRGAAATAFTTSNQVLAHQALLQDKLDLAIYPMIAPNTKGGHYVNSTQYFTVSEASTNKETATDFINFFVHAEAAAKVLGVERGVSAFSKTRAIVAPTLDEAGAAAVNFVDKLGPIAGDPPPPPPAKAGEIEPAFVRKSQEVAFGQQSPSEAGKAFFEEIAEILKRG